MFQESTEESKDQSRLNFDQKKDFRIEDIPIRTMRQDLKNLSDSNLKADAIIFKGTDPARIAETIPENKSGPFLSRQNWTKEEKLKPKENVPIHHTLGKLTITAVIAFIFLAVAFGGYYFWITRMDNEQPAENIPLPSIPSSETSPNFAIGKPNYLSLDIENYDKDRIKKTLQDYAIKVSKIEATSPVEFIITDSGNNPVNFSVFAQKLGLTLSEDILLQLNSDFSLYIYTNQDKTRLGLSISIKNPEQLKINIIEEEKNLVKELEPLYLASDYILSEDKSFDSAIYNAATIRYINITSPEDLSADYAIYNNQLIIGTTKLTMHSIIDYIDQQNSQSVDNL